MNKGLYWIKIVEDKQHIVVPAQYNGKTFSVITHHNVRIIREDDVIAVIQKIETPKEFQIGWYWCYLRGQESELRLLLWNGKNWQDFEDNELKDEDVSIFDILHEPQPF